MLVRPWSLDRGARGGWVLPHPINPRLPKSATPVGATRDLAHWVGDDSVRVAKGFIATRPPLNSSGQCRPACRGTGTAHPMCASPRSATVQQPSCWPPLPRPWETSDRPAAQHSRICPTRAVRVVAVLSLTRARTRRADCAEPGSRAPTLRTPAANPHW